MNAFKIWITTHPTEPDNQEFSLTEPLRDTMYEESTGEFVRANWVEHICIPIQE